MYGPEFPKSHRSELKFDAQQSYDVPDVPDDPEVKMSLYSYDCNVNPLHPIDWMINFYSELEILLKDVVLASEYPCQTMEEGSLHVVIAIRHTGI